MMSYYSSCFSWQGLVTTTRGDKLAQHKVYYARDDNEGQQYKELIDIVNYVKPTA